MTNPDFPLYTSMHSSTSNSGQSLCRAASMNDSSGDCPPPEMLKPSCFVETEKCSFIQVLNVPFWSLSHYAGRSGNMEAHFLL